VRTANKMLRIAKVPMTTSPGDSAHARSRQILECPVVVTEQNPTGLFALFSRSQYHFIYFRVPQQLLARPCQRSTWRHSVLSTSGRLPRPGSRCSLHRSSTSPGSTPDPLARHPLSYLESRSVGSRATDTSHLQSVQSHVCVLQTALELLNRKFAVHVLADGVSSCNKEEVSIALEYIRRAGGHVSTSESVAFQLMRACRLPSPRSRLLHPTQTTHPIPSSSRSRL
jgi:hypothetical protein